jgi:hypothetical protein
MYVPLPVEIEALQIQLLCYLIHVRSLLINPHPTRVSSTAEGGGGGVCSHQPPVTAPNFPPRKCRKTTKFSLSSYHPNHLICPVKFLSTLTWNSVLRKPGSHPDYSIPHVCPENKKNLSVHTSRRPTKHTAQWWGQYLLQERIYSKNVFTTKMLNQHLCTWPDIKRPCIELPIMKL